jgi:hypothetical protein
MYHFKISRETEPPEEQVILPAHLLYFGGISQRSRPVHDKDPVFYSNLLFEKSRFPRYRQRIIGRIAPCLYKEMRRVGR